MTYGAFVGGVLVPPPFLTGQNAPAYSSFVIDASAEKVAFIIQVPETGVLNAFEFILRTVTQAPANGLTCSFQDLSGNDPDGTPDQYRVVTTGLTTNAWVVPGLLTSDGTDTGTKRSVTKGQFLACVVAFTSFTAGDNVALGTLANNTFESNLWTYINHFTSSWAITVGAPVLALQYSDGHYAMVQGARPASAITALTFHSDSTPDEQGITVLFPFPCEVSGFWVRLDLDNPMDMVLYDADGTTVLASSSLTSTPRATTGGRLAYAAFATPVTLLAGQTYRLAAKPTTASTIGLSTLSVPTVAHMAAMRGGPNWQLTTRTGGGSWSQTTTIQPLMGLIVNGFSPVEPLSMLNVQNATIASGVLTLAGTGIYLVETEAGAASDDITTIVGLALHDFAELRPQVSGHWWTLRHSAANGILLPGGSDFVTDSMADSICVRGITIGGTTKAVGYLPNQVPIT